MSTQRRGPLHRRPQDPSDKTDAVLAALRHSAPATVSALAAATGFSPPTVTAVLSAFAAAGVATESVPEEQAVGRPARTWDLCPEAGLVVGLDLLPGSALVAAAGMRCHVLASQPVPPARLTRPGAPGGRQPRRPVPDRRAERPRAAARRRSLRHRKGRW